MAENENIENPIEQDEQLDQEQDSILAKRKSLYERWEKRNAHYEKRLYDSVIHILCDYGIGASERTGKKGYILGAGYESYIIAFFLGLYSKRKKSLKGDVKSFGQPIQFWGNLDSKKGRTAYSDLRKYMFIAAVAKTDIDWVKVDKDEIKTSRAISDLINTMDEYANYGYYLMEDKLNEDPNYFIRNTSFLDMFLSFRKEAQNTDKSNEEQEIEADEL